MIPGLFSMQNFSNRNGWALGEHNFKREYLGIPVGAEASPFSWDLYERATRIHAPLVPAGPAFAPPAEQSVPVANPFRHLQINRSISMNYDPDDVTSWPGIQTPDHCP